MGNLNLKVKGKLFSIFDTFVLGCCALFGGTKKAKENVET